MNAVVTVQYPDAKHTRLGRFCRTEAQDGDLHAALDRIIADPAGHELVHERASKMVGSKRGREAKAQARMGTDDEIPGV